MGENYQVYRAAVNAAKGIRQFQKADNAIDKDKVDSAAKHFDKALGFFASALDHLEKAEDDAHEAAAKDLKRGNGELKNAIDSYGNDDVDGAAKHYSKALEHYDAALDALDA